MSEPWAQPECYWCRQSTSGRCVPHASYRISTTGTTDDRIASCHRSDEYYLRLLVIDALRSIGVVFDSESTASE